MNQRKTEIVIICLSILLTFFFSAIFGFAGSSIYGKFWGWFWVTFLIQVIRFAVWNFHVSQAAFCTDQQAEIDALEPFS